jgi:hypothetical protein
MKCFHCSRMSSTRCSFSVTEVAESLPILIDVSIAFAVMLDMTFFWWLAIRAKLTTKST